MTWKICATFYTFIPEEVVSNAANPNLQMSENYLAPEAGSLFASKFSPAEGCKTMIHFTMTLCVKVSITFRIPSSFFTKFRVTLFEIEAIPYSVFGERMASVASGREERSDDGSREGGGPPAKKGSIMLKGVGGISDAQNSFSANSPYFSSYVENELASIQIMDDALRDIAARTKTFGKCGALMSESTRRLAMACRLQRPTSPSSGEESKEELEYQEQIRQREVEQRRRAVGEDMASLLSVMSEVSEKKMKCHKKSNFFVPGFTFNPVFRWK